MAKAAVNRPQVVVRLLRRGVTRVMIEDRSVIVDVGPRGGMSLVQPSGRFDVYYKPFIDAVLAKAFELAEERNQKPPPETMYG